MSNTPEDGINSTNIINLGDKKAATAKQATYHKASDSNHVPRLGKRLLKEHHFAVDSNLALYHWEKGNHNPYGERVIHKEVMKLLDNSSALAWTPKIGTHVEEYIRLNAPLLLEVPPMNRLNLLNGVLNLDTMELKPHLMWPEALFTSIQLPIWYDPEAKCPFWKQYVQEVLLEENWEFPFEALAWLMLPNMNFQRALILVSQGSSGKSTLLTGLRACLGSSNYSAVSLKKLATNEFAMGCLLGKLANIHPDISNQKIADTEQFKALVGGDYMPVEKKFKDATGFQPITRLIFSGNAIPPSDDDSLGWRRRWLPILFPHRFDNIPAKKAKLDFMLSQPSELSGVLNEALRVLPRILAQGLTIGPTSRSLIGDMKDNDYVGQWITDNLMVGGQEDFITNEDLETKSRDFLRQHHKQLGQLRERLRDFFPEISDSIPTHINNKAVRVRKYVRWITN